MSQAEMELDRRRAARLSYSELQELTDRLICHWYQHEAQVASYMRRIQELDCQLALERQQEPGHTPPEPRHHQWARELLGLCR